MHWYLFILFRRNKKLPKKLTIYNVLNEERIFSLRDT